MIKRITVAKLDFVRGGAKKNKTLTQMTGCCATQQSAQLSCAC